MSMASSTPALRLPSTLSLSDWDDAPPLDANAAAAAAAFHANAFSSIFKLPNNQLQNK